jgi:hypothetical protein
MQTVEKKCSICGEAMQVDPHWKNGEVSHWQCAYDTCKEAREATEQLSDDYVKQFMK